ncbi:MAG: type II secretion system protein [Oscillospiraceae bacterium]|nr:type II secretion system protein [Oscillospiraceae bacterium]MDY6208688.1 type II secretion system protein [Oscillospiraceae bacterium]
MNKSKPKLKGFTLLELIIVIAILAVMMAILVPSISDYIRTNHIRSANSQAQQIYMAAQDYLVYEQIKGTTTNDIVSDSSSIPTLCWIVVTTEPGYDSSQYDDTNKTTVVASSDINSDFLTKNDSTTGSKDYYRIADGIESRLGSDFKGSWMVAFYPKTFTVAYAVFNDYYKTTAQCEDAVKLIGTDSEQPDDACAGRIYKSEFNVGGAPEEAQESDFMHADTDEVDHMYTGQYPIPVPYL